DRLELRYSSVSAPGISEDIALLLAFEKGAEALVGVGTHFKLTEFLERDRAGMSSTFVTRLKVGEILIDAKGVSRLVSRQVGLWPLILFAAAGLGAVVVAIVASPGLRHFIGLLSQRIRDLLGLGERRAPCRPTPRARSCSPRGRTSGSSWPSHAICPTGGRASPPSRPTAAASPPPRAGSCMPRCGPRCCADRPRSRRCR